MPNSSFDNNFLPFKSITSIIFHRVRYRSLLLLTCSFRGYDKGAAGPRSTHISPSASAVPLTSLSTAGPPFQDATRLMPIPSSYFRHCILQASRCIVEYQTCSTLKSLTGQKEFGLLLSYINKV